MIIEGGTGNGYRAGVTPEHRLLTYAVTATEQLHVNTTEQECYSIVLDQNPTSTNDCVLYIKNTSDMDLVLVSIGCFASGATELYFQINNTGTATSATTLAAVNRNAASSKTADATIQQGPDLQLTAGDEVDRIVLSAANLFIKHRWDSGIILPKNGTFTIWTSADMVVNATLTVYFHD